MKSQCAIATIIFSVRAFIAIIILSPFLCLFAKLNAHLQYILFTVKQESNGDNKYTYQIKIGGMMMTFNAKGHVSVLEVIMYKWIKKVIAIFCEAMPFERRFFLPYLSSNLVLN